MNDTQIVIESLQVNLETTLRKLGPASCRNRRYHADVDALLAKIEQLVEILADLTHADRSDVTAQAWERLSRRLEEKDTAK